ncbi:MAG: phospholipase [Planctomycetaceae bacterium]|nr:phospholipase [Planctomycetaceae bacterium]
MNLTTDALGKLHRIHQQLADLRSELERGPLQIKAGNANLDRIREINEAAQENLTQAKVACAAKQLQLQTAEDRITDLKRKRNECGTNKEFQSLIEQIAADEMATSVLSDEILEIMEKIDEHQKTADEAQTQVESVQEDLEKFKQRVEGKRQTLETDIGRISDELTEKETALPANFKTDYDRVVKARGDEALAAVEGEMCSGCYQMVTSQMLNDLYMSRPVFCKSCGRLLYLPEDSKGG